MDHNYKTLKIVCTVIVGLENLTFISVLLSLLYSLYQRWADHVLIHLFHSSYIGLLLIGILTCSLTLFGIYKEKKVLLVVWLVLHSIIILFQALLLGHIFEILLFTIYGDILVPLILITSIVVVVSFYACIYRLYVIYAKKELNIIEEDNEEINIEAVNYSRLH